jgi:hypothetical protein
MTILEEIDNSNEPFKNSSIFEELSKTCHGETKLSLNQILNDLKKISINMSAKFLICNEKMILLLSHNKTI